MKTYFFDFESTSESEEVLTRVKPTFKAPANYKKPEAIAESIADQEKTWRDRAALEATTGRILCIGTLTTGFGWWGEGSTEKAILEVFWEWLDEALVSGQSVVGFNILNWDLPMAVRRSYINGVKIPSSIRRNHNGRSYWHEGLVDVMAMWQCGNYQDRISLDILAKSLGLGAKTGSGADFGKIWAEDRTKALEYLQNDLMLTKACYERMI